MNYKRLTVLRGFSCKRVFLRCALGLAVSFLFVGHAGAQTSTWNLDPAHTLVRFSVRHMMISNVRLAFDKVSGTVQFDPKDLSKTSIQATIDATSEESGVDARDKDVKTNYLEVDKFPTITFQSKRAEPAGEGELKVTGDLTIHGVTKEVVLDVTDITPPVTQRGVTHIGAVASTAVSRKDYGIVRTTLLEGGGVVVGDEVNITIDIDMSQGGGGGGRGAGAAGAPGGAPPARPTN